MYCKVPVSLIYYILIINNYIHTGVAAAFTTDGDTKFPIEFLFLETEVAAAFTTAGGDNKFSFDFLSIGIEVAAGDTKVLFNFPFLGVFLGKITVISFFQCLLIFYKSTSR